MGAERLVPEAILFMIVGPHSGFSLDEIFVMKQREEERLGYFYWGYAGSLCHPSKVCAFASKSESHQGVLPRVVMSSTNARYVSRTVGKIRRWSADKKRFKDLEEGVTLIGCTVAILCKNLRLVRGTIDLNDYSVANGKSAGAPLGEYIRYQVNKACGFRSKLVRAPGVRVVDVVAVADLVRPFCVHLAE